MYAQVLTDFLYYFVQVVFTTFIQLASPESYIWLKIQDMLKISKVNIPASKAVKKLGARSEQFVANRSIRAGFSKAGREVGTGIEG